MVSPEIRSGMTTPSRRHCVRRNSSCKPDHPPCTQSGQRLWRQSGQSRSCGPLACARYCAKQPRCMRCRRQVGNGTGSWSARAAGCRRSKQTQQHSSSALAGLGGVRSPASRGGAGGETELTDSGEGGARSARSGVSERDARASLGFYTYKGARGGPTAGRWGAAARMSRALESTFQTLGTKSAEGVGRGPGVRQAGCAFFLLADERECV